MAKDSIENKIFHIYLQLGFIIPSTFLLIGSECIHWFSCISIPFLFGVLPAFILIFFLKKGKSRQKQDYSSSDSDSSDGGDVKKLPATTKASLNQTFPLSAVSQPHEEACLQNFLSKNKNIDENIAADIFSDLKDKLKFDFLCLKKGNANLMMTDPNVEEEIHTKETNIIEKDVIKRKPAKKIINKDDLRSAVAVENEDPIYAVNTQQSSLVSILKIETHEEGLNQLMPNVNSQQFLLDYVENKGVESISANDDGINDIIDATDEINDATDVINDTTDVINDVTDVINDATDDNNDTLKTKSASGVESISAGINDSNDTDTHDEPSTASHSTTETNDSEEGKKGGLADVNDIPTDKINLEDTTQNKDENV